MSYNKKDNERKFENLKDGKYTCVLDNAKLDLANQYGARLQLTFKHDNNRLTWLDMRENNKNGTKSLAGAWATLGKMGLRNKVHDSLSENYELNEFLETALRAVEDKIGHYYELELKTFTTQAGKERQYANVVKEVTEGFGKAASTTATEMDETEIPF